MPKVTPRPKLEEHISPEQFDELVSLHRQMSKDFTRMCRLYRTILGTSGRPSRYKKSSKQTALEVVRANARTLRDVKKALDGQLPVEVPEGFAEPSTPKFTGKDLGTDFPGVAR